MSNLSGVVPTSAAPPAPATPVTARIGAIRTPYRKATDFLAEVCRVGSSTKRAGRNPKYTPLKSAEMFTALVELYSIAFQAQNHLLKRVIMTMVPMRQERGSMTALARIYVSHWFHDLYVTIRESCLRFNLDGFTTHYSRVETYHSHSYDYFMKLVNASIRATHIKGAFEDALYVPVIAQNINWNSHNPFSIQSFTYNFEVFRTLIEVMADPQVGWSFDTLSNDALGRPCWLFDWPAHDNACAWFPVEGNYSLDDVTLAYIIGVACTPPMAPRDTDEWQDFPDGVQPDDPQPSDYQRIANCRSTAQEEFRSIEIRNAYYDLPNPEWTQEGQDLYDAHTAEVRRRTEIEAARARTASSGQQTLGAEEQTTTALVSATETAPPQPPPRYIKMVYPEFRLVDWLYINRVIHNTDDNHTRSGAHRALALHAAQY